MSLPVELIESRDRRNADGSLSTIAGRELGIFFRALDVNDCRLGDLVEGVAAVPINFEQELRTALVKCEIVENHRTLVRVAEAVVEMARKRLASFGEAATDAGLWHLYGVTLPAMWSKLVRRRLRPATDLADGGACAAWVIRVATAANLPVPTAENLREARRRCLADVPPDRETLRDAILATTDISEPHVAAFGRVFEKLVIRAFDERGLDADAIASARLNLPTGLHDLPTDEFFLGSLADLALHFGVRPAQARRLAAAVGFACTADDYRFAAHRVSRAVPVKKRYRV